MTFFEHFYFCRFIRSTLTRQTSTVKGRPFLIIFLGLNVQTHDEGWAQFQY